MGKFRKDFRFLAMLIACAVIANGCRKMDAPSNQQPELGAKFLLLPPSATPEVRRVAEALKRKNERTGLLNQMAKQCGFAIWDKAVMGTTGKATKNTFTRSGTGNANDTILYIPLALENANHVNAFIYARLNGTVNLQFYRANDYESHGFGNLGDTANNAEKLALQFMLLDYTTFGHKDFKVIDDRLFNTNATVPLPTAVSGNRKLHIEPMATHGSGRFETISYTICTPTAPTLNCHGCGVCSNGSCSSCQELC